MISFFLLLSIVFAFNFEQSLKSGQRRFISTPIKSTKPNDPFLSYDIELVEGFHHLDYDSSIEDIICTLETLSIFSKEKKTINIGDVVAGDGRWGCGEGIARVVEAIFPVREQEGYYEYHLETRQATLEDLFVKATFSVEVPEEEDTLKGDSTSETFSYTFSRSFERVLKSYGGVTVTAGADVSVPVKLSGLTVDVDNDDNTKTFKMTVTSGLTYTVKTSLTASKEVEGEAEGELGSIDAYSFTFSIGIIPITINVEPTFYAGVEYSFDASATATLSYTKKYSATVTFTTDPSPKLTSSASDTSPYNSLKLTLSKSLTAELSPYVKGALEIKGKVFGIPVLTGTPYLKVKITGTLNSLRSATFTPSLAFGYTVELLGKDLVGGERNLKST